MRRLKIAVCLIFVASCVIFAGYTVKSKMLEDHTPPVITCKDKTVTLSVQTDQKKQKKALLKGVKAEDNRDGDLTSSVRIASMSHFIAPGKRTITYVVFDKANQVGTLERTIQYKDYTPPKIHLKAPLRYSTTEVVIFFVAAIVILWICIFDHGKTFELILRLDESLGYR